MSLGPSVVVSAPPRLVLSYEEPMKIPCSPVMPPQWISTPPGLQACLKNRCASENSERSTAAPSPLVLNSPRRPSTDSFALPEDMLVKSEPSGESNCEPIGAEDLFSLFDTGRKKDQTIAADLLDVSAPPRARRSFSALCVEPSQLMMLRGEAGMQGRDIARVDMSSKGGPMRTFDGLCLEFNPERLPFLNASLHSSLPGKDESSEDEEIETVVSSVPTPTDIWASWKSVGASGMEMGMQGMYPDGGAAMLPGCMLEDYTEAVRAGMHHGDESGEMDRYRDMHQWYLMRYGDSWQMEHLPMEPYEHYQR